MVEANMSEESINICGQEVQVLDHGFVRVVDTMGDDAAVCQAARVSYGSGTKSVSSNRNLIRYLMRHRHTTPFEMAEIKLHVKLPIFVARQWIRHRTANVNEYSARYSILDNEFYIPESEDVQMQSVTNAQGREEGLETEAQEDFRSVLQGACNNAYAQYSHYGEKVGVARETARMILPNNIYTQWYWKVDVNNLLHFLSLRADPHAQMEIRVYADAILDMVKQWMPATYEAFNDYVMEAVTLSRIEYQALIQTATQSYVDESLWDQMSIREQKEFEVKFLRPILQE